MKTTILVAIAAVSMTAFAQTNTGAPATTTTTDAGVTTEAPATVAKGAKKSTVKKAKAAKGKKAATKLAPSEDSQGVTNKSVAPGMETQSSSAAPANSQQAVAGTSTTKIEAEKEVKKWSASLVAQTELSNDAMKNIGANEIGTTNYVGAGYKINKTDSVGARQYFTYTFQAKKDAKLEEGPAAVTYGTKWKGVAGSDEIAPLFWYYLPNAGLKNGIGAMESVNHNGLLRMDAEIAWKLSPNWTVSYYVNPRQSFVPTQTIHVKGEDGVVKEKTLQADSRLIHQGYLYYNFNDNAQVYTTGGFDHRMRTTTLTSHSDEAILAVGAYFAMGKFSFNPEIGNTVPLKKEGQTIGDAKWLQTDDIKYTFTAALAL